MSSSSDGPRAPTAVISRNLADLLVPGMLVELDAAEAESLGAFAETALTEAEAWDANPDLKVGGPANGE